MNECKIVEDLLPLYAEDLISAESADFIREHASRCPRCNKLLERTEQPLPETTDIPNYKKALKRERIQSILTGVLWSMLLVLGLAATIWVVGFIPQKLDVEPTVLESPDGIHSITAEPHTSLFGTNEGLYITWRSDGGLHGGTHQGWIEILDARWSPDGTDLFLTVRMKNGETRMEIWYHNYGENGSDGGYFPYFTKNGWDYDDLSAECTKLLTAQGKLPSGWTSITYEFVKWGDDSESVYLRWKTDNGHEEITYFGFGFIEKNIWIIE